MPGTPCSILETHLVYRPACLITYSHCLYFSSPAHLSLCQSLRVLPACLSFASLLGQLRPPTFPVLCMPRGTAKDASAKSSCCATECKRRQHAIRILSVFAGVSGDSEHP